MLPTTQFTLRKGLVSSDVLLSMAHTLLSALEMGQEAGILQINFSTTFDRVNHQGNLFKLYSVGIQGSVLSVLTQFLSNWPQYIIVDGCLSKLFNVVLGVTQESVFMSEVVTPEHHRAVIHSGNKLYNYAYDSTLVTVVPFPGERVAVTESSIHDLNWVSMWCDLLGMKLNVRLRLR